MPLDLSRLTLERNHRAAAHPPSVWKPKHDEHDTHSGGRWIYPLDENMLAYPFPSSKIVKNGITDNFVVSNASLPFSHVRCENSTRKCLYCGNYTYHMDSLVIAVDGACPGSGTENATKSAVGVYFGDFGDEDPNQFRTPNVAMRIPDHEIYPHTNQRAELHAAIAGLVAVKSFVVGGGQWKCNRHDPDHSGFLCRVEHVVIKSDSAYLVNSAVLYLPRWLKNGWKTANKDPVANRDLWDWIAAELDDIHELGATVCFWHVPRDQNVEADRLANLGLKQGLDIVGLDVIQMFDRARVNGIGPPGLPAQARERQPGSTFAQLAKYYRKATDHARHRETKGMFTQYM